MQLVPAIIANSIRNKVIVLGSMIALLSSVFVVSLYYSRTSDILIDTAVQGLAGETRLMASKFKDAYDEMKNDAFVVSQTPPIEGIIRSSMNGGVDPFDGSTTELWRKRLEAILSSIMAARPHYTQMRYIGIADDGRELVRINRGKIGLETVPFDKLQSKGQEPYFQAGIKLKYNHAYYSELNYNREHGKTDEALIPTVRVVIPVYSKISNVFGLIVINVDYKVMLFDALEEIRPSKNIVIFNYNGDYIHYDSEYKTAGFEYHENYTQSPPVYINDLVNSFQRERVYFNNDEVSYFVRLAVDHNNKDSYLGVVMSTPEKELMAAAENTGRDSIILSIGLVLVSMLLAAYAAGRLTKPLVGMTGVLAAAKSHEGLDEHLPIHLGDEIGDLARAFSSLAGNLGESEAKAQAVLDTVVDGIITIDQFGTIDSMNPACEKIFGYQADEVIGRNVGMLMPDSYRSKHDQYLENYQETGVRRIIGIGRELIGRRKNGDEFSLDLAISETQVQNRKVYTGIVRDITERKQIEMMKNEFISMVNHELRTPLTSIQASLGLMKAKSLDQLDAKGKRLLEISYENCGSLSSLVNDILDIEKIAAGKMEFYCEVCEMRQLVKDIVEKSFSYADKYNVKFDVQTHTDEIYCMVDPGRFNQALLNIMSNAAKFSPDGGVVAITMVPESIDSLRISVTDKGQGIPAAFQDKIFERFAQADSSSTRAKGGSGLGLNITKSIVEAFGGTVAFNTAEGKGTTFYFVLPVCDRDTSEKQGNEQWLKA